MDDDDIRRILQDRGGRLDQDELLRTMMALDGAELGHGNECPLGSRLLRLFGWV